MKTQEIRRAFLDYFASHAHQVVSSGSLIPGNDPTLLFTNAGMVQFKEAFLGQEKRGYCRATSSQCCVRAGGKHNDLDNVGYTARHHTFFEMLGNFSFGDYFKREAIVYAWTFLTEHLHLPEEKLWVTVYLDDDEAAAIWENEIKIPKERIIRCGEKDNFWSMGDTGPCGPCTEIFYDHGSQVAGGPPGSPDEDGDRYIEIWNLVFMQYNRTADGQLHSLPKPSVDTGMGLERIAAVVQGVHSNYDIDLFQYLLKHAAQIIGIVDHHQASLKVIADHIRSCSFLILDGVIPSNEGRGYVLRRIVRRAVRHGNKLGAQDLFFHKLVSALADVMGEAYPDLTKNVTRITETLKQEEIQFAKTLEQGLKIFETDISTLKTNQIPGETIFKLYDTYGFPVDLTGDIARERGLQMDLDGFEACMATQRENSRKAGAFKLDYNQVISTTIQSDFTGYDHITDEGEIKQLITDDNQKIIGIILDKTPFYAESGGQVGDIGDIVTPQGKFKVQDTHKAGDAIVHYGELASGEIAVGDKVVAQVDVGARVATMANHSVTHLLHAALKHVLGEHVIQKGSLVDPARLRFDFAHQQALTQQEVACIELLVNEKIRENTPVTTQLMSPDAAKAAGACALFGEKYGDSVRVLTMGDFSKELCGGTHVKATGDIGYFKLISESGIAAGIRRIEAVSGEAAVSQSLQSDSLLATLAQQLKASPDQLHEKLSQLIAQSKADKKSIEQLRAKLATSGTQDVSAQATEVGDGIKVLATQLDNADMKTLRASLDQFKSKFDKAVIVLVGVQDDKIQVVAGTTKNLIGQVPSAKDFVAHICGRGGGRDDMAQGGGPRPDDLADKLAHIKDLVVNH